MSDSTTDSQILLPTSTSLHFMKSILLSFLACCAFTVSLQGDPLLKQGISDRFWDPIGANLDSSSLGASSLGQREPVVWDGMQAAIMADEFSAPDLSLAAGFLSGESSMPLGPAPDSSTAVAPENISDLATRLVEVYSSGGQGRHTLYLDINPSELPLSAGVNYQARMPVFFLSAGGVGLLFIAGFVKLTLGARLS
jgi:hypothetical protein